MQISINKKKVVHLSELLFDIHTIPLLGRLGYLLSFILTQKFYLFHFFLTGYRIKKDTLIFLDNYDLSMSEELWDEPHKFKPDRFIVNGHFVKPNHFLPFGGGRRGCMGYKMVQLVGFGMLTNIMQHFTVLPANFEDYTVPVGSLALPFDTYSFNFVKRGIDIVI